MDALHHTPPPIPLKRAVNTGGYVWGSSLLPIMDFLSFERYEWNTDATPRFKTSLPKASKGRRELVKY